MANESSKRIQNESPPKKGVQRFYAIIEVETETYDDVDWDGDKYDMAAWIDHSMCVSSQFDAESTVWDNLADFIQDNALEALADVTEDKASSDRG